MPQPSSTRQVSSTGLSRRCCLRASPDRPTWLRLAVPKWTRRQGEETPLGPSSGEETPISQDGMSYRVRSLPSSLFHPSNRALPSDCVARVEKLTLAQVLAQAFETSFRLCAFQAIKSVSRTRLRKTRKELIQWFCIYWRAEGRLQGLSEQFLGQRQRRLEIPKMDKIKRLPAPAPAPAPTQLQLQLQLQPQPQLQPNSSSGSSSSSSSSCGSDSLGSGSRTFLLRIETRPEQRTAFERQANRYLADLQGSRSSSSTTSVDE